MKSFKSHKKTKKNVKKSHKKTVKNQKKFKLNKMKGGGLIIYQDGNNIVCSFAFNPSGTMIVSGNFDGTIQLWNVASYQLINTTIASSFWKNSVAFNHDGSMVVSGCEDGYIKLWSVNTAKSKLILINKQGEYGMGKKKICFI